jgi:hypothetical protein
MRSEVRYVIVIVWWGGVGLVAFNHWRVDAPIAAHVIIELVEVILRHPTYELGEEDAIVDELVRAVV